ncbi:uncharacterized protein LOC125220963 isoform X2 [Salvia hispanica]|uniref:uncharacterized protein LOC125220963 isoform X2 n=1 Tax=Salvia hispanica TaxID=49212 RepID=UPI0020095C74|nr:uncharacterized protein LOC125220963 isoform X2 [Salvia hispanica]
MGKSQWEKPIEEAPAAVFATSPLLVDCIEAFDETTGQKYYYNRKTNVSQWEHPGAQQQVIPQRYETMVSHNAMGGNLEDKASPFPRCLGCGGWGVGLVHSWGYCNHCTRLHNLPQGQYISTSESHNQPNSAGNQVNWEKKPPHPSKGLIRNPCPGKAIRSVHTMTKMTWTLWIQVRIQMLLAAVGMLRFLYQVV